MSKYKYTVVKQFNDGYSAHEETILTFDDVEDALDYADERNQKDEDYIWYAVEVSR